MIELDAEFLGWLASWAWRFHAIIVFVRGYRQPQPLFLVLLMGARC